MVQPPFVVDRIDVPSGERREEQVGTKAKFWFDGRDTSRLFKRGRLNEDWSEKAAGECAELLGLPHAVIELAECEHQPGVVSPTFLEAADTLVHGNEVLLGRDPSYPQQRRYHVVEHTLEAIFDVFARNGVEAAPRGSATWPARFGASEIFVGYLLLDAWVGNSDRHHENWAIIRRGERQILAPTYDHASSLGRNETPERVQRRLVGDDPRVTVAAYAERCRSALYRPGEAQPTLTFDAFMDAAQRRPDAAAFWLGELARVEPEHIESLFARFPPDRLPDEFRRFAIAILHFNRTRLLLSIP